MSSSITVSPPTFLSICAENLDPQKISALNKKSTLWNVAAISTLVAFAALSLVTFVTIGLTTPIYTPLTGITIMLFIQPAVQVYQKFKAISDDYRSKSEQFQKINGNYHAMNHCTPQNIQNALSLSGIQWSHIPGMAHPENLLSLKPLIAKQRYFNEEIGKLTEQKQKLQRKVESSSQNPQEPLSLENREKLFKRGAKILNTDHTICELKVCAAFINAVIQRPSYRGTSENLFDFTETKVMERLIGQEINAPISQFVYFKNRSITPLTVEDVKRLSVAELGTRLLAAMPPA